VSEHAIYRAVAYGWLALSAITLFVLLGRAAPYGRHARPGWGPTIAPRWGWLIMELPAAITIAALSVPLLSRDGWPQAWLLVGLWELHYVNRAFVYPFRLRSTRPMPLTVVTMGFLFNLVNGWLNARGLTTFGPELGRAAIDSPRVIGGVVVFLLGLAINWDADARLLRLRRDGAGYSIPHGGLYAFISCPNYLGEILEWSGFAIAAGSLAALGFAAWTIANLVPRALAHHRWYREQFPDYPRARRAIVPFLI
jgi:protein-S-isoprenylcysteine O-methyltransferase Ste14